MTQPYLGEIRMFGGNFAPRTNALCNGQLLSIQQNSALFSLLGTFYGGNGTTNFALPDLRGRLPVAQGTGPGLSTYVIGQQGGTESVTITMSTLPMHNHMATVTSGVASTPNPGSALPSAIAAPWGTFWVADAAKTGNPVPLAAQSTNTQGGNQPHENRMGAIAISMIIALSGIFPSRN